MRYAAPVWHFAMQNVKLMYKLSRLKRKLCIRICSAYRSISAEGAEVIAGVSRIDLLAKERFNVYNGMTKQDAREQVMTDW